MNYQEFLELLLENLELPNNAEKVTSGLYTTGGDSLPIVAFGSTLYPHSLSIYNDRLTLSIIGRLDKDGNNTNKYHTFSIADPDLINKLQNHINSIEQ